MSEPVEFKTNDAKASMLEALNDPEVTGLVLVFQKKNQFGIVTHQRLREKPMLRYQIEEFLRDIFRSFFPG